MGKNSRFPYAIIKQGPEPLICKNRTAYPHRERADAVYSQWLVGYTPEEIANFFSIPVQDVETDVQHIRGILPTRVVLQQNNDRCRILLQREQSENFRRLMAEALKIEAKSFLVAGISPAGILKEFRESVGMVQKAESLVQIQQNFASPSQAGGGIRSAEDLIRSVLRSMEEDPQLVEATAPEPEKDSRDIEDTIQDDEEPSSPFEPPDGDE
jgi:hypothetical protein